MIIIVIITIIIIIIIIIIILIPIRIRIRIQHQLHSIMLKLVHDKCAMVETWSKHRGALVASFYHATPPMGLRELPEGRMLEDGQLKDQLWWIYGGILGIFLNLGYFMTFD